MKRSKKQAAVPKQLKLSPLASAIRLGLVSLGVAHGAVHGATIRVNDFTDPATAPNDACTLRAAIESANTNAAVGGCVSGDPGLDTIRFDTLVPQTIGLTQGQLEITQDLGIRAPFHTPIVVDGSNNGNFRNLFVNGATVSIDRLTISGASTTSFDGGGISVGSSSTLNLSNSTVSNNTARLGGGIYASTASNTEIRNTTISGNFSSGTGGGIDVSGATLSINNSTISGNSVGSGSYSGGINAHSGTITIANSTITGNSATASGGGIGSSNMGSTVQFSRSIVSGNSAPTGADIENFDGRNTFTGDNNNVFGDNSKTQAQAFANFTPGNSDFNATTSATTNGLPYAINQILDTNLADNGGSNLTHNLVSISPALDSIYNPAYCDTFDQRGLLRGDACDIGAVELMPQTQTIVVDSLAGDFGTANTCSLESAILAGSFNRPFNGCEAGGVEDTIVFSESVFPSGANQTITLTDDLRTINFDVTIQGKPGLTIDANGVDRVFDVSQGKVLLDQLIITGGSTSVYGGGVSANFDSDVTISRSTIMGNTTTSNNGGGGVAVSNRAILRVVDSTVSNNQAPKGGGGMAQSYGRLEVLRSTLKDNVTVGGTPYTVGGGVSIAASASGVIMDSTLSTNQSGYGGGFIAYGDILINNSTLSGNSAADAGGGGYVDQNGNAKISSTTIAENLTPSEAVVGGIQVRAGGQLDIANSIVANNQGGEVAIFGRITADQNNLFGDSGASEGFSFFRFAPGPSDINAASDGTQPTAAADILGPLQDNGGATFTHELVLNSPAIDAGNNALCPSTDQRGERRNDGKCDIGAFELIDGETCYVIKTSQGKVIVFCL